MLFEGKIKTILHFASKNKISNIPRILFKDRANVNAKIRRLLS